MLLYHSTTEAAAESILREGFRNGLGIAHEDFLEGVWLADIPAPYGEATLRVDVPDNLAAEREVVDESPDGGCGYREFILEAALLNQFPVARHDE